MVAIPAVGGTFIIIAVVVSERMASEPDPSDERVAFTSALARLKREGSNLLVVGGSSDVAHAEACDRFLGDEIGDRRRTFVSTERSSCVSADVCGDDADLIRYESPTRSAAATTGTADGSELPTDGVSGLSELGAAVVDSIRATDEEVGGLEPAQFRLCLDSMRPLLEEHTEREVFRFLHAVTNEVRAADGMGHYHLPVGYDSETVRTLEPLFDAVVEVRAGPDGAQQRWHLRDVDADSDWLPL